MTTEDHGSPSMINGNNSNKGNKKAFLSKANLPLADRCIGYMVNKFKQVLGQGWGQGAPKWSGVYVWSHNPLPHLWTDRLTDMTENISFPESIAGGKRGNIPKYPLITN